MSPLVAGVEPAKSCTDACSTERIVYRPTRSEGQMAVSSVPPDTIRLCHPRQTHARENPQHFAG